MRSIAKYRKRQMAFLTAAFMAAAWMPTAWAVEVEPKEMPTGEYNPQGLNVADIVREKDSEGNYTGRMDVDVHSGKGIINWKTFNIGKNASVNFDGPAGWMVLNRVDKGNPSEIYGKIIGAGGTVFLVNPDGITFHNGASVDVGSFVASTMDVKEEDGKFTFTRTDDNKKGITIEKAAKITARDGYVAILAHTINNQGIITAPEVAMAAGEKIILSYDDKIDLALDIDVLSDQPVNAEAASKKKEEGFVKGTVNAKDGYVLMTKQDATNLGRKLIKDSSITNGGTIQVAKGITFDKDGNLVLSGDGGKVTMAAAKVLLDNGSEIKADGAKGGIITTTGYESLLVRDGAKVHAKAEEGAGTWNIDAKNVTITENKDGKGDKSNPNKVSNTVLNNALSDADVKVVASPDYQGYAADIMVEKPIKKANGTDVSLTLAAGRNISVDADVSSVQGKMDITLDSSKQQGTNSGREDGASIIRADIDTNGGNFTAASKLGTYFGATPSYINVQNSASNNKKLVMPASTDRKIVTKGGDITLEGDDVQVATGGKVILDAGPGGNVTIKGNVNSAHAYYDGGSTKEQLIWKDARENAKDAGEGELKGKTYLAVITSPLEDAVATSTVAKDHSRNSQAFVGGHVVKVKTDDKGYPVYKAEDGTWKRIQYTEDANNNPVIIGTPVIDEESVVRDENGKIIKVKSVMEGTETLKYTDADGKEHTINTKGGDNGSKGWYIIEAVDSKTGKAITKYAHFWAWTEGTSDEPELGKIFFVQTTGENIIGNMDDYAENSDRWNKHTEWLKDHGVAMRNDSGDVYYTNFARCQPDADMGQDSNVIDNATKAVISKGTYTQMALAVNYDTHTGGNDILYSKWNDVGDGKKQDYHYVVEANIGTTALNVIGKEVEIDGKVGNLTALKNVNIDAVGDVTLKGTVNVDDTISVKGKDVAIYDTLTAKARNNNDAIDIRAQEAFLNMSGSSQVLNVDRENNSHWKVYSDTPYKDDFGSGVGQGNDKEKDLYSDSFAVWGDTGFTYNPVEDRENRFIFKYRPTLTFAAKDLPVKAYDEKWTGLGYPEGYTVTNSLSGRFLRAFRDGQNEAGENALVARGDVMEKIGQVITDSQGFTSEVKGIYPITFKFKDGNALNENTLIAPGYKNEFSGSMSVNGKPEPPVTPVDPPVTPVEPPVTPVEPPVTPVEPPVTPVEPPVTPVEPPVTPVEPPVTPVEPPVMPADPPVTPVEPTNIPVDPVISPEVEPPVFEAVNEPQHSIVNLVEKPQIDGRTVAANIVGSASYVTQWSRDGASADRVLGLQTAELPIFNVKHGKVALYGTYDVSVDPDKVQMKPTAKVLPEPDQPKNQYREYERELTTSNGTGRFRLTYNGSTFDIYPADENAAAILAAGDGKKNVEVETQALFAAFNEMGITLDDLNGVYTHFERLA